MKAGRQHVQQEAAHELLGRQAHRFMARVSVFAIVLPAEGDGAIIHCHEPRVGDRYSMGVAGQIGENLLRSRERSLGIDDPLALAHWCEPVGEGLGVGQIDVLTEELQLAVTMQVLELFEEAAPEEAREYPDREEEAWLARHPAVGIRREAAARHDAVHMRMMSQRR